MSTLIAIKVNLVPMIGLKVSLIIRGSVTHTNYNGLQYWQIDLGRVYKIHHITIYGRTDCCSERIQGARVSDSDLFK